MFCDPQPIKNKRLMSKDTPYKEKLLDPRWQRKRLEILARDEFKCRDTGNAAETLHVHHCHYSKNPWETPSELLLTLCATAHKERQELEDRAKMALGRIMAQLDNDPEESGLESFVKQLEEVASSDDLPNIPSVQAGSDADYLSAIRWYFEAIAHPEFRPIYDSVTGTSTNWQSVDDATVKHWNDPDAQAVD